jgi:hypothetical protein
MRLILRCSNVLENNISYTRYPNTSLNCKAERDLGLMNSRFPGSQVLAQWPAVIGGATKRTTAVDVFKSQVPCIPAIFFHTTVHVPTRIETTVPRHRGHPCQYWLVGFLQNFRRKWVAGERTCISRCSGTQYSLFFNKDQPRRREAQRSTVLKHGRSSV